ncbi:MAG: response regulator [Armatimonadetes bacterium]|jgi:CheY-like chemotaxis protein|nr:response regulator [Armatimonadota bacterium]MDI9584242.1 response regulator [Acidobacteriota bacterium]
MPRILVVDDDAAVREVIQMQLEMTGMEADTAANGRIALEKLCTSVVEGRPYDLVTLDIVMPELNGWQVLKAVKNNPLWQDIKVIVVSGELQSAEDLTHIIEYDGVFVEKRIGFTQDVGLIVQRILEA